MRGQDRFAKVLLGAVSVMLAGLAVFLALRNTPPPSLPMLQLQPMEHPASTGSSVDLARWQGLADRRMSREIPPPPPPAAPPAPPAPALESLIALRGILKYPDGQASVAVVELLQEQRTRFLRPGDAIGQTGAVLREIREGLLVEYDRKRFKVSYRDVREVPLP